MATTREQLLEATSEILRICKDLEVAKVYASANPYDSLLLTERDKDQLRSLTRGLMVKISEAFGYLREIKNPFSPYPYLSAAAIFDGVLSVTSETSWTNEVCEKLFQSHGILSDSNHMLLSFVISPSKTILLSCFNVYHLGLRVNAIATGLRTADEERNEDYNNDDVRQTAEGIDMTAVRILWRAINQMIEVHYFGKRSTVSKRRGSSFSAIPRTDIVVFKEKTAVEIYSEAPQTPKSQGQVGEAVSQRYENEIRIAKKQIAALEARLRQQREDYKNEIFKLTQELDSSKAEISHLKKQLLKKYNQELFETTSVKRVRQLVEEEGADVNAKNKTDRAHATAVYYAAERGDLEIVRYLIEHGGCDIDDTDVDGWTALMKACENRHQKVAKILIDRGGASVDVVSKIRKTPLMLAAINGCRKAATTILAKNPKTLQIKDDYGRSAWDYAVYNYHADIANDIREKIRSIIPPSAAASTSVPATPATGVSLPSRSKSQL